MYQLLTKKTNISILIYLMQLLTCRLKKGSIDDAPKTEDAVIDDDLFSDIEIESGL